jgi:hypothetical protein
MKSRKKDDKGYKVGYGKPPEHTRFKRGKSGNPKGRPKGNLNTQTILERVLNENVTINENGMRKTVTKREAAAIRFVNTMLTSGKGWKDYFEIIGRVEKNTAKMQSENMKPLTDEELTMIIRQAQEEEEEK